MGRKNRRSLEERGQDSKAINHIGLGGGLFIKSQKKEKQKQLSEDPEFFREQRKTE